MLAEDVQLELVGMTEKSGATDVGGYFNNYARLEDMRLERGEVDGRQAILALEQSDGRPVYVCSSVSAANGFGSSETTATRGKSSMKRSGPVRQKNREGDRSCPRRR